MATRVTQVYAEVLTSEIALNDTATRVTQVYAEVLTSEPQVTPPSPEGGNQPIVNVCG